MEIVSFAVYDYNFLWLYESMVATVDIFIFRLRMKSCHESEHSRLTYSGFICSITGGGTKKDEGEKKKEDILNVFSVASGHLYERFLRSVSSLSSSTQWITFRLILKVNLIVFHRSFRIMMLSVLRHTNTPVKFWFLKNYLSPSFKVLAFHFKCQCYHIVLFGEMFG